MHPSALMFHPIYLTPAHPSEVKIGKKSLTKTVIVIIINIISKYNILHMKRRSYEQTFIPRDQSTH